jgi:hypothetical protein
MPQLVGDDIGGQSDRVTDQMEVIAEPREQRYSGCWPGQELSVVRQRIQGAKESQAMNEITDEGIHGDHTLGFEFAQGHVNRPLVWTGGAQAVVGEVNTLADSHTGVSEHEEDISAQIVAAQEFLLEELILFSGKRTRQTLRCARNILAPDEVSEVSKLVCPGQLVEDGTQSGEACDAS